MSKKKEEVVNFEDFARFLEENPFVDEEYYRMGTGYINRSLKERERLRKNIDNWRNKILAGIKTRNNDVDILGWM